MYLPTPLFLKETLSPVQEHDQKQRRTFYVKMLGKYNFSNIWSPLGFGAGKNS